MREVTKRKLDTLTSSFHIDHGAFRALAGHCVPSAIRVLDPLCCLTVKLAFIRRLQVVDCKLGLSLAYFIQADISTGVPLGVITSRTQYEIPAEGDHLHGRLICFPSIPGDRNMAVLHGTLGYLTLYLQRIMLHFV